jgi:flavin-dependent dehydrogenase
LVYKVDYTVVGSGIVGLHAALRLREPESKILVLEKECYHMVRALRMLVLPAGISEIIDDLNHIQRRKFIS